MGVEPIAVFRLKHSTKRNGFKIPTLLNESVCRLFDEDDVWRKRFLGVEEANGDVGKLDMCGERGFGSQIDSCQRFRLNRFGLSPGSTFWVLRWQTAFETFNLKF